MVAQWPRLCILTASEDVQHFIANFLMVYVSIGMRYLTVRYLTGTFCTQVEITSQL